MALGTFVFLCLFREAAGQDFSESRLREGEDAYRAHHPSEAVDLLRIAAFGLLDRPARLCEALVYLALANETTGLHMDAQSALERRSEVEHRFPACGEAELDQAARSELESRFHLRLPAPVSATPTPAQATSKPSPALKPQPSEPTRRPAGQEETAAEEGETPARIKKSVPPVYPPAARTAGVGGTVILRVLVSEMGKAMQVEVVSGVRPDLADAAIVAMQYWTFEPARKNGRKFRAWMTVEVPFRP